MLLFTLHFVLVGVDGGTAEDCTLITISSNKSTADGVARLITSSAGVYRYYREVTYSSYTYGDTTT